MTFLNDVHKQRKIIIENSAPAFVVIVCVAFIVPENQATNHIIIFHWKIFKKIL